MINCGPLQKVRIKISFAIKFVELSKQELCEAACQPLCEKVVMCGANLIANFFLGSIPQWSTESHGDGLYSSQTDDEEGFQCSGRCCRFS